jgi:hypothetical protein
MTQPYPQYDALLGEAPNPSAHVMWKTRGEYICPYIDGKCNRGLYILNGSLNIHDDHSRISVDDMCIFMKIAVSHRLISGVMFFGFNPNEEYIPDKELVRTVSTYLCDVPQLYIRGRVWYLVEFLSIRRSESIGKMWYINPTIAGLEQVLALQDDVIVNEIDIEFSARINDPDICNLIRNCTRLVIEMIRHPVRLQYRIFTAGNLSEQYTEAITQSLVGDTFHISDISIYVGHNKHVVRNRLGAQMALLEACSRREWSAGYDCDLHHYFPQKTRESVEALELATSITSSRLPPELMSMLAGALVMSC